MKTNALALSFFLGCLSSFALNKPLFDYDFSKPNDLALSGGAKVENGVLKLDGKKAFATVPGSNKMHLTERGLTLLGEVKLVDEGPPDGKNEGHDMILAKGREFIFGRNGKNLYINFHDGAKWAATTIGGKTAKPGEWVQYAAVFERFNDVAQGDVGYRMSLFINGEPEFRLRHLMVNPKKNDDPVLIGSGFGGGPWHLNGEVGRVAMYDRSLTDGEVARLFEQSKRVSAVRKGFVKVDTSKLDALHSRASEPGKWLLNAFTRSLRAGLAPEKVPSLDRIVAQKDIGAMVKAFNAAQKNFALVQTPELVALLALGDGKGSSPVMGALELDAMREIFGDRALSWQAVLPGKKEVNDFDGAVSYHATLRGDTLEIVWTSPELTLRSRVRIAGKRIESDAEVLRGKVDSLSFPVYSFAKRTRGKDMMLLPWMCGVLVPNPTEEQFPFGQEAIYPSGRVAVQFGAYYDGESGVYYAFEDPLGRSKFSSVLGKRGNLHVYWQQNSGKPNGKSVVELFKGDWFDAAGIYRNFLERQAAWWIKDLPRKDTPKWFRDNTLWFLGFAGTKAAAEHMANELKYYREYFDLPLGVHWYGWDDGKTKPNWPHFHPHDFVPPVLADMRKNGIYVKPYIDNRLWAIKDGPDYKSDYMYTSHGLKYAVKKPDNSVYTEDYGNGMIYTVMCPAVKAWQEWMVKLSKRITDYGFDAVYHDQVATARALACYDKTHGHPMGDPSAWLEKGYWPMFRKIRKACGANFCHDTEENAEPYLRDMDGYMVWRWTNRNQVPMFQSIYSGRAQFTGRTYNHQRPGDAQSFFCKAAQQLVNAEQLGWFTPAELRRPDAKRLFIKKAMHVRLALLDYFNSGRMLRPVRFRDRMPEITSKWGGVVAEMVTMPQVASGAFVLPDGRKAYIFVNTLDKAITCRPEIKGTSLWACREGASVPVKADGSLTLKPYGFELWTDAPRAEADRIQQTMKKIASFDMGKPIGVQLNFKEIKKHQAAPGKVFGVRDVSNLMGCTAATDASRIGWIRAGGVAMFGDVDFGKLNVDRIELKLGVAPEYENGEIEMVVGGPGKPEQIAGSLKLKSSGGFRNYQTYVMPLKIKLDGVHRVWFRFQNDACCDFISWTIPAK